VSLTFRADRPFSGFDPEGLGMTKKKYEAPVLRKTGKLSSVVAVTSKTL
jgi:hypothetical protein